MPVPRRPLVREEPTRRGEAGGERTRSPPASFFGESRSGASTSMKEARVLDGINRWRYGTDPELLREWEFARHVVGGPHHPPDVPGTGEGPSLPVPGKEAPAA
jgi:hypothetical protein